MALLKFGSVAISNINDGSPEADACKVYYPLMRDELMSAHNWNFALSRADITASSTVTPAFQFDYAYVLPVDCLRVVELYGTDDEWVREKNNLLTNKEEGICIRYVERITTSGDFSPAFATCLALRLAAELAAKIREDSKMRSVFMAELERYLSEAYRLNAIEGNKPRHKNAQPVDKGNYSWQTEGR
jgi:hypothetical protein